jgi:hypothetical protein
MAVARVCEANSRRFDEQAKLVAIGEWHFSVCAWQSARESCGFLGGQNGFVERAIREANATLESLAERAGSFKHNRNIKVSR